MRTILITILILATAPAFAQVQHAPTLDICRADQAVWVENTKEKHSLSYDELSNRIQEMTDCSKVDPEIVGNMDSHFRSDRYDMIRASYENEERYRLEVFLSRHNLGQQFLVEDAAGAR